MQAKTVSAVFFTRYTFILAAVLLLALHFFNADSWSEPLAAKVTPFVNKFTTLSHVSDVAPDSYGVGVPDRLHDYGQLRDQDALREKSAKCDMHITYQQNLLYRYYAERLENCTHAAVVGLTIIDNPGDSALFTSLLLLMQKLSIRMVYGCPFRECDVADARRALQDAQPNKKRQCILGNGGGNMQDHTWIAQETRLAFVEAFPYLPITFLPQSIQYDDKNHDIAIQKAYAKHGDVVQGVRDALSYERVRHWKKQNLTVDLIPDHAQLHGIRQDFDPNPEYTFIVLPRKDSENGAGHQHNDAKAFRALMREKGMEGATFYMEDWNGQHEEEILAAEPDDRLSAAWLRYRLGMDYLALGELIITDRLHATIVGLSIGKSIIVMEEGSYQKVWGYYKTWLWPGCNNQVRFSKNGVAGALELAREWYTNGKQFP